MNRRLLFLFLGLAAILASATYLLAQRYLRPTQLDYAPGLVQQIKPPTDYERIKATRTSFAWWLRNLPLKEAGSPVLLYNGNRKYRQDVHVAVVDLDVGDKDLQQCADAAIRLRAEYLFSRGYYDSISFNFTSGDKASFRHWITGRRPKVRGNEVAWIESGVVDSSYRSFRSYLNTVFTYAGTYSLERELKEKTNPCEIAVGDLFIQGGFPGHTVIVVDVAAHEATGERVFLLAQSFMPAQDIHILKNPGDSRLSPWYDCDFGEKLKTPEWTFKRGDLRGF